MKVCCYTGRDGKGTGAGTLEGGGRGCVSGRVAVPTSA